VKRIFALFIVLVIGSTSFVYAASVKHNLGTTMVESTPKRVVVIGLGALDALDYFGITPIAVSKGIAFPPYLKKYDDDKFQSSGSLFEPDFEAIYNLKPDLIVVGARSAKSYKELSDIAPTLLFAIDENAPYWVSTKSQWRKIGTLFGIEPRVESVIKQIEAEISVIKEKNSSAHADALTIMSSGGNITAFGAKSRFSSIYTDFGYQETVKGVKESRHGDLVSYEFIRDAKPSNLFVIDRDKLVNKGQSHTRQQFNNPLVKATPAYQNHRMVFLNINAWYLAIAGVNATKQMIQDMSSSVK